MFTSTSSHGYSARPQLQCSVLKPGARARARGDGGALMSYRSTLSTSRSSVDLSPVASARSHLGKAGQARMSPAGAGRHSGGGGVGGSGGGSGRKQVAGGAGGDSLSSTQDSFVSAVSDSASSPVRITQRIGVQAQKQGPGLSKSRSDASFFANGQREFAAV